MRIVSNLKAMAGLPVADQLKQLHQAATFEVQLPQMYLDMHGGSAAGKGVTLLNGRKARDIELPHVKAFLGQKFATPSDNPILTDVSARVESFFHANMPEQDLGWTNLFEFIDLRGTNQDAFDILDTNAGVVFAQTAVGETIKIKRAVAESKLSVPFVTYKAGLGILDDWLRFSKFWNIEQAIAEFNANYWDKQAEIHYGLLTAQSAGIDTAFATDDTVTFNAAAATIIRNVRTKGFAVGQSAQFWIVCAPEKVGRILRMLEATQGSQRVAFQSAAEPIAYTVAGVIATAHVPASDTGYYLVLPNRKIQRGTWDDLAIESNRDIYAGAQDWVGTCRFNAAIGEVGQLRRVLYA